MQFEQKRLKLIDTYNSLQDNEIEFNSLALSVFNFQKEFNPLYRSYLESLDKLHFTPDSWNTIPCFPIQFFKQFPIQTGTWQAEKTFYSSGTGGTQSKHLIKDVTFYINNTKSIFASSIAPVESFCYLALLPGYLEREGSSLIEMVEAFINSSEYEQSGFYLDNFDKLNSKIQECTNLNIPTILFGVSFALLDFIEQFKPDLSNIIIIETGGMKGKSRELSKSEIISRLQTSSKVQKIYSEYGMTELQSQAYALDGKHFKENTYMKVFTTELNDPFCLSKLNKSGQLNVVDLANIDSCAFLQTEDLAKKNANKTFEILGRIHQSDLRGCNLLLEEIQ